MRGFSLLELAIVFGVAGALLASLWGAVGHIRENTRREELLGQIELSVKNIRSFFQNREYIETDEKKGTFDALTDYLLRQGVLPMEMIRDRAASTLRADTPWGGSENGSSLPEGTFAVDNTQDSDSFHNSGFFRIQLRGLSFATCVYVTASLSTSSKPPGLSEIKINNNSQDLPLYVDDAASSCSDSPSGEENKVDLIYRLRWVRK